MSVEFLDEAYEVAMRQVGWPLEKLSLVAELLRRRPAHPLEWLVLEFGANCPEETTLRDLAQAVIPGSVDALVGILRVLRAEGHIQCREDAVSSTATPGDLTVKVATSEELTKPDTRVVTVHLDHLTGAIATPDERDSKLPPVAPAGPLSQRVPSAVVADQLRTSRQIKRQETLQDARVVAHQSTMVWATRTLSLVASPDGLVAWKVPGDAAATDWLGRHGRAAPTLAIEFPTNIAGFPTAWLKDLLQDGTLESRDGVAELLRDARQSVDVGETVATGLQLKSALRRARKQGLDVGRSVAGNVLLIDGYIGVWHGLAVGHWEDGQEVTLPVTVRLTLEAEQLDDFQRGSLFNIGGVR